MHMVVFKEQNFEIRDIFFFLQQIWQIYIQAALNIALLYPNSNTSEDIYATLGHDQHFENILLSYKSTGAIDNSKTFILSDDFRSFLEPLFYSLYII